MITLSFTPSECRKFIKAVNNWGFIRKKSALSLIDKFTEAEKTGGPVTFTGPELMLIFRIVQTAGPLKKRIPRPNARSKKNAGNN